jgi:hypothetical protein
MNIKNQIVISPRTLIIQPGKHERVDQVGNYFLLKSNSSGSNVHIAIGDDNFMPWDVLWSWHASEPADYFDNVKFYNPTALAMTIQYVICKGIIDNKSAQVIGVVDIDDTSNGIATPAAITVQPKSILINAAVPVDVGGGVVGIPLTGQPFTTGDSITITGCPQYNGTYTVLASSSVNQVDITATFNGGLIDAAAAVDKGGGKVGIPITGHPYATGEKITIANAHANYNGLKTVDATSSVNEVVITAVYAAYNFDGANDSHCYTFDGVDDKVALAAPKLIAGDGTRKELHITNHDTTNAVYFGDVNVDPDNYRGIIIQPNSVYILTCTADIYLACLAAVGVAGVKVSYANMTKT